MKNQKSRYEMNDLGKSGSASFGQKEPGFFAELGRWLRQLFQGVVHGLRGWLGRPLRRNLSAPGGAWAAEPTLRILRQGKAMRVIFFYPGEEGTFLDHCDVILYENGIVHLSNALEESTTHLQNCEVLWRFEVEGEERSSGKVRLLKPRDSDRNSEDPPSKPTDH